MIAPNPWMTLPFALLLAAIAIGPLLAANWWLRHYAKISFGLGIITLCYYFLGLQAPGKILHAAHEDVRFIALVGSLYVVTGGIHVSAKGEASPRANVIFGMLGDNDAKFLSNN